MHDIWFLDMTGNQLLAGLLFTVIGVCASPFFNDLYAWAKGKLLGPGETKRMGEGVVGVSAATSAAWGFLSGAVIVGGIVLLTFGLVVGGFVVYRLFRTKDRVGQPGAPAAPPQVTAATPVLVESQQRAPAHPVESASEIDT